MNKKLLEYNFPDDLKQLENKELDLLSYEIRDFLIENLSKTKGHLTSKDMFRVSIIPTDY